MNNIMKMGKQNQRKSCINLQFVILMLIIQSILQMLYKYIMKMIFAQPVLMFIFVITSFSINQKCKPLSEVEECPQNSYCQLSGFCNCDTGWALDCQTKSAPINKTLQTFNVTQQKTYYTIVPSDTNLVFVYKFTFCTNRKSEKAKYTLTLYADEGTQKDLSVNNRIGGLDVYSKKKCWQLYSPYMEFGTQPNGHIEQMIMEVKIPPSTDNLQNIGQDDEDKFIETIQFGVEQIFVANLQTLWIVIFVFLSLITLTFIGGIVYCVYFLRFRRNRRGWDGRDNDISFFQELFPKKTVKAGSQLLDQDCPICLSPFSISDKVRTVVCNHNFHVECLDQWCKKRINCPVCRTNLEKSEVERIKSNKNSMITRNSDSFKEETGIQDTILNVEDQINLSQQNQEIWKLQNQLVDEEQVDQDFSQRKSHIKKRLI